MESQLLIEEKETKIMTEKFDINKIRQDFPILHQQMHGKPFVYFDSGATAHKPKSVIEIEKQFYERDNSNIHRGVHTLSEKATVAYEEARVTIQKHINASCKKEIIFTSGATDSINLVAYTFGEKYLKEGDEIIVSEMEHHSNIVPWQIIAERKNAKVVKWPITEKGELELDKLYDLINDKTKLIAFTHISNVLGTVNPVKEITKVAHEHNIPVLVDGAQAIQHVKIDVQELDCDFYVFSGHKVYAPTGIGILYGKRDWLDKLPPFRGGGDMIDKVTFEKTTFNEAPLKFEAGTPNFTGAICLAEALKYINEIGIENIAKHEEKLVNYTRQKLSKINNLTIVGNAKHTAGCISFNLDNIHHYDIGMIIDKLGIAVRTGTHCAQPIMDKFGITGTIRVSFGLYNTIEEIDTLIKAIKNVKTMFGE